MPKRKQQLDLSFARAAKLLLPVYDRLRLFLVGCGGTGSWLAPSVARIAKVWQEQGHQVDVTFCDPDYVEPKNIPRQNFCDAELKRNKAATLAFRYSAAWGLEILAIDQPFKATKLPHSFGGLTILIGCVDNAAARREIANAVMRQIEGASGRRHLWWLDCGNNDDSGQVLVGCATAAAQMHDAFPSRKICKMLPAPSLIAPDLLEPRPEEIMASKLSCADIQLANAQSLAVNQQVAAIATDYLLRMLSGTLKRFATYFDLESGSMRSRYITPEEVQAFPRTSKQKAA